MQRERASERVKQCFVDGDGLSGSGSGSFIMIMIVMSCDVLSLSVRCQHNLGCLLKPSASTFKHDGICTTCRNKASPTHVLST